MALVRFSSFTTLVVLCALGAPAHADIASIKRGLWQSSISNADGPDPGQPITKQICITDASVAVIQAQQDRLKALGSTRSDCTATEHDTPDDHFAEMVCKDYTSSARVTRSGPDHFTTLFTFRDDQGAGAVHMGLVALKTSFDWIGSDCGSVTEYRGAPNLKAPDKAP